MPKSDPIRAALEAAGLSGAALAAALASVAATAAETAPAPKKARTPRARRAAALAATAPSRSAGARRLSGPSMMAEELEKIGRPAETVALVARVLRRDARHAEPILSGPTPDATLSAKLAVMARDGKVFARGLTRATGKKETRPAVFGLAAWDRATLAAEPLEASDADRAFIRGIREERRTSAAPAAPSRSSSKPASKPAGKRSSRADAAQADRESAEPAPKRTLRRPAVVKQETAPAPARGAEKRSATRGATPAATKRATAKKAAEQETAELSAEAPTKPARGANLRRKKPASSGADALGAAALAAQTAPGPGTPAEPPSLEETAARAPRATATKAGRRKAAAETAAPKTGKLSAEESAELAELMRVGAQRGWSGAESRRLAELRAKKGGK